MDNLGKDRGQLLPGGRRAAAPQGQPGSTGSLCYTLLNGFIFIFFFYFLFFQEGR